MYNTIINPITKQKISIVSSEGKQLLKNYVLQFKGGMNNTILKALYDNNVPKYIINEIYKMIKPNIKDMVLLDSGEDGYEVSYYIQGEMSDDWKYYNKKYDDDKSDLVLIYPVKDVNLKTNLKLNFSDPNSDSDSDYDSDYDYDYDYDSDDEICKDGICEDENGKYFSGNTKEFKYKNYLYLYDSDKQNYYRLFFKRDNITVEELKLKIKEVLNKDVSIVQTEYIDDDWKETELTNNNEYINKINLNKSMEDIVDDYVATISFKLI